MKKFLLFTVIISLIGIIFGQEVLFQDDLNESSANWTFVNGNATNKWFHGYNAVANPTGSLYISNAATGTTNPAHNYSISNSSRTYAYTTLPQMPANAIGIVLTLSAICYGETTYDFFKVFLKPGDFVPTASTNVSGAHGASDDLVDHLFATGITNAHFSTGSGTNGSAWTNMTFNIPATQLAGQTKRLVFMWRNDASMGEQPPVGIDNILISYTLATGEPPPAMIVSPLNNATGIFVQQALRWSPTPEAAQPTGYKIHFGTTPDPPFIDDLGLVTSWVPTPVPLWDTTYYWQVITYNDVGDATDCPVWSYTTAIDPTIIIFPHNESFDTISTGQIPNGWGRVISQPPSTNWAIDASAVAPVMSTPNHLRLYNGTSNANAMIIARTPPIQNIT